MTRFEKLKQMSIEEVAEWLVDYMDCKACPVIQCRGYMRVGFGVCQENVQAWLNEEEPEVCSSCAIDFGDGERRSDETD